MFLSKEERAAQAIARRQAAIQEQRKHTDKERSAQKKFVNEGRRSRGDRGRWEESSGSARESVADKDKSKEMDAIKVSGRIIKGVWFIIGGVSLVWLDCRLATSVLRRNAGKCVALPTVSLSLSGTLQRIPRSTLTPCELDYGTYCVLTMSRIATSLVTKPSSSVEEIWQVLIYECRRKTNLSFIKSCWMRDAQMIRRNRQSELGWSVATVHVHSLTHLLANSYSLVS